MVAALLLLTSFEPEIWYGPAVVSFDLKVEGSPFDALANDVRVEFESPRKKETRLAFFDGKTWKAVLLSRTPGTFQPTVLLNGDRKQKLATPVVLDDGGPRRFVRVDASRRRFVTADGKPFWPMGHNLGWQNANQVPNLIDQIGEMGRNGLNWARIWACHWDGKNPYWLDDKTPENPRDMFPSVLDRWESIVKATDKAGVFFQFVLFHHGPYSSRTDSNWAQHPWNAKNGGFLPKPDDFFTDPEAIRRAKNWLRYAIARWGHESSIMAWELFNEVEWVDAIVNGTPEKVEKWHQDMADYIRSLDPYHHLVTTSSHMDLPIYKAMDYYQPHGYPPDVGALVLGTKPTTDKPLFFGEVGVGGRGRGREGEPLVVRDALWSGLMAGHAGSAQYWYWDRVLQYRMYPEFQRFTSFLKANKLAEGDSFAPQPLTFQSRQAGAVSFAPGRGWDSTAKYDFNMPEDAANGALGQVSGFVQGSGHRDMVKEPIKFRFSAAKPGKFTLTIGTIARQGATVLMDLDGVNKIREVFGSQDQDTPVGRSFSMDFPAGTHTVSIFNDGPDWYTVDRIQIDRIGQAVGGAGSLSGNRVLIRLRRSAADVPEEAFQIKGLPSGWSSATLVELDLDTGATARRSVALKSGVLADGHLKAKDAIWLLEGK